MTFNRELHEKNRLSWNAATAAHNSHKPGLAAFLKAGGSTLFAEERELLGDIDGQSLVHLFCSSGGDSLSLAGMGASVTGVDISDVAIAAAETLTRAVGVSAAAFVRMDVCDWLAMHATRPPSVDVVYCSYGALCWVSNFAAWAVGVASVLKPGGRFVSVEFHPVATMFDDNWSLRHSYFGGPDALMTSGVPDYVAEAGEALVPWGYVTGVESFENPHPDFTYQWSLSDILNGCMSAGLTITTFREYSFANGTKLYPGAQALSGNRFGPPSHLPALPLMFGLVATKPE